MLVKTSPRLYFIVTFTLQVTVLNLGSLRLEKLFDLKKNHKWQMVKWGKNYGRTSIIRPPINPIPALSEPVSCPPIFLWNWHCTVAQVLKNLTKSSLLFYHQHFFEIFKIETSFEKKSTPLEKVFIWTSYRFW